MGELTVRESRHNRRMSQLGFCECGCGQPTSIAPQTHRAKGWVKGQPLRFVRGHAGKTHGHSSQGVRRPTPTYLSWQSMWARCTVTGNENYRRYVEQGIKVCERWERFENFLADMGERPVGRTLDRIDSGGDYKPENCRWATPEEQARNRKGASMNRFLCPHGHALFGDNLYVRPDGKRICRTCAAEGNRRYRQRQRA